MKTRCEVIGWLCESDQDQVLVREADGHIRLQTASFDSTFAHQSVQTGVFRRGNPILDPITSEILGYEMESMLSCPGMA